MYYKEEMEELEKLHKEKAGIKTKQTVKKRKSEETRRPMDKVIPELQV